MKGFSLVEVMVAAVIFTIAVAGVFASLASSRKPTVDTDTSLRGALCGQQILEKFRAKVDWRDWSSGSLVVSGTPYVLSAAALAALPACSGYGASYVVSNGGNGARKVKVTVSW